MSFDIIFTDWSIASEHSMYFYLRGAIWGFVVATLFWNYIVPWIKKILIKRKFK